MFDFRTLRSIRHGRKQEIGTLGSKSSVRQRSARSPPLVRRIIEYRVTEPRRYVMLRYSLWSLSRATVPHWFQNIIYISILQHRPVAALARRTINTGQTRGTGTSGLIPSDPQTAAHSTTLASYINSSLCIKYADSVWKSIQLQFASDLMPYVPSESAAIIYNYSPYNPNSGPIFSCER